MSEFALPHDAGLVGTLAKRKADFQHNAENQNRWSTQLAAHRVRRQWLWGFAFAVVLFGLGGLAGQALAQDAQAQQASAASLDSPFDEPLLDSPIVLPQILGNGEIGGELIFSADSMRFNAQNNTLLLVGGVEVYGDNVALLADELYLDQAKATGFARGNVLARINGSTIALDELILDEETALLLATNVRVAIDGFADATARRVTSRPDGRTLLDNLSYTPCQNCIANGVEPLWHIQANRVELDQRSQQMFLFDATLHFFGVPILPLPYIQTPAPGTTRQTGFLRPIIESQSGTDMQVGLPYFWAPRDNIDLTIFPSVSFKDIQPAGGELRLEYRQAVANGALNADLSTGFMSSSVLDSDLDAGMDKLDAEIRLHGELGLGRHWKASWDWTETTDEDFDEDFLGQSEAWTTNRVELEGFNRRNYVSIRAEDSRPANQAVDPTELRPDYFPVVTGEFISEPNDYGMTFRTLADLRYLERAGAAREYARIVTDSALSLPIHLGGGLIAQTRAGLRADGYFIQDNDLDNNVLVATSANQFSGDKTRAVPYWQVRLDWPIALVDAQTAAVWTPTAAVTWVSDTNQVSEIPNEDNHHSELDGQNLFDVNRSGGWDWIERGTRLDLGAELKSVTSLRNSVFDADKPSSLIVNAFVGLGVKFDAIDRYDADSGLDRDLTELVADVDATLTNFGSIDVDTRWDLDTREMTRGAATATLNLPRQYTLTTSAKRQVWQEPDSWSEQFSVGVEGLLPFTDRQYVNSGYSLERDSTAADTQWIWGGVSGELGSGDFLYPWKYTTEYRHRVDGTHGQEVKVNFGYDCDCADFFIDTKFTSDSPDDWDAEVSFKFDLATLAEDITISGIQSWFGY